MHEADVGDAVENVQLLRGGRSVPPQREGSGGGSNLLLVVALQHFRAEENGDDAARALEDHLQKRAVVSNRPAAGEPPRRQRIAVQREKS